MICQTHNLKVAVTRLQPIYLIKSITYIALKEFNFLCFKPDNDYRVINNVFNVIQTRK